MNYRESHRKEMEMRTTNYSSWSKEREREESMEIFKDLNDEETVNCSKTKMAKDRKNRNDKTHFYRILCIEVPDDKATVAWWFYFFLSFFFFFVEAIF